MGVPPSPTYPATSSPPVMAFVTASMALSYAVRSDSSASRLFGWSAECKLAKKHPNPPAQRPQRTQPVPWVSPFECLGRFTPPGVRIVCAHTPRLPGSWTTENRPSVGTAKGVAGGLPSHAGNSLLLFPSASSAGFLGHKAAPPPPPGGPGMVGSQVAGTPKFVGQKCFASSGSNFLSVWAGICRMRTGFVGWENF